MAKLHDWNKIMRLSGDERHWAYNALDCIATMQVFDALTPLLDDAQRAYYRFIMSSSLPAFDMNMRGMLVDRGERSRLMARVQMELRRVESDIRALIRYMRREFLD